MVVNGPFVFSGGKLHFLNHSGPKFIDVKLESLALNIRPEFFIFEWLSSNLSFNIWLMIICDSM